MNGSLNFSDKIFPSLATRETLNVTSYLCRNCKIFLKVIDGLFQTNVICILQSKPNIV